jgi:thymidine kinase
MFAAKTTELLRKLKTYSFIGKVLYINSDKDVRSEEAFSIKNSLFKSELNEENFTMIKSGNLEFNDEYLKQFIAIGVDEGQFFTDIQNVERWVDDLDIHVYIASLNGGSNRMNFGLVHELMCGIDDVIFLKDAYCTNCASNGKITVAIFSHLKDKNKANQKIVIGGKDKYMPLCRQCFKQFNKPVITPIA